MTRWHRVAALALVAVGLMGAPPLASAQAPPRAAAAGPSAMRGEAWFFQRCSLCHVGRVVKDDSYKPMSPPLAGVLKGAAPDREAAIREQIQRGSLRMPGFRYNFTPAEFEDLMAYLKTL